MATVRLNPAIHFFATCQEVALWLCDWVPTCNLHCVVARHPTTMIHDLEWHDPAKIEALLLEHTKVYLRQEPINTQVENTNYLRSANGDMLIIYLPILCPRGLKYGDIWTGAKDRAVLRTWKKIGADFLSRTKGGMWQISLPPDGCITFAPEYRYSDGAAELWRSGMSLLGVGKKQTWHIEEPPKTRRLPRVPRVRG